MAEELRLREDVPSRIERKIYQEPEEVVPVRSRPSFVNFAFMVLVAIVFDIIGLFTAEVPFVGAGISITSSVIFIPWFYMSGMNFNNKRVVSMAAQTIAESVPFVGNFPLITVNVIYSYYSS
jgi:hypothetical protein